MRDTLCSYYTNSSDIISYMLHRLDVKNGDVVLEPSAGEGVFIDELLNTKSTLHIDALDIDQAAISILKEKYKDNPTVSVRETDTLFDEQLDLFETSSLLLKKTDTLTDSQLDFFGTIGGHYDKIVGNPPYGAWQDYDKRELLKRKYPGQYVKETYSLFLLRCISVLKIGGKLSFIIPDTYMFLNLHTKLRELLLTATKIQEIIIFPSSFFPGVSFGYSNLSIITLERSNTEAALGNKVHIIQGFHNPSEFKMPYENCPLPHHLRTYDLMQSDVFSNEQHRFILADTNVTSTIKDSICKLSDVADIVTGFYTGDNKRFIRALDDSVKGAKNYDKIDQDLVYNCVSLNGIPSVEEGYIPYIKSSSPTRYCRMLDTWFVRWDEDTIRYYNSSKKARFQNALFYFKRGIAIPMVKSSQIKAFLIENRVFDQSIVGIFPKDPSKVLYILALMNSDAINELLHVINPTANNSANYVKQIPYKEPCEEILKIISDKVREILKNMNEGSIIECDKLHREINNMINDIYHENKTYAQKAV